MPLHFNTLFCLRPSNFSSNYSQLQDLSLVDVCPSHYLLVFYGSLDVFFAILPHSGANNNKHSTVKRQDSLGRIMDLECKRVINAFLMHT